LERIHNKTPRTERRKINQTNLPAKGKIVIIISDELNAKAMMDKGHLEPYLTSVRKLLSESSYSVDKENIVLHGGLARCGYQIGTILFNQLKYNDEHYFGILHVIGERPGTGNHNYSVYITMTKSRFLEASTN
jgi:ethanolamine ammonia-lyase large subunit